MKKVILPLVIGGLSISGDCFAVGLADANSQQNKQTNSLVQVKSGLSKVGVKTKEALKRKDVQIALGTAAVIGSGVAAYYFVPGVSNFVNSNAKTALDVVKNSNQYKLVSSKLLEMGKAIKSSNAFKAIQNSKVGSLLGIKPKPSKVEKVVNGAANIWNSYVVNNWNGYVVPNWNSHVVPNWNYYVANNWNSMPTWSKWTAGAGGVAILAGGKYYAQKTSVRLASQALLAIAQALRQDAISRQWDAVYNNGWVYSDF